MGLVAVVAQNGAYALVLTSSLFLIAIIAFGAQRVYFHSLSKYPGPFLAKFTDLYAAYHAWKGDIHLDMMRCHEKYGPFVRYSPEQLNVNSAVALKDIYGNNKNFTKSPNYRVMRHGPANTLTMIDKKQHSRRRRIMAQGVSDAAMRTHEFTLLAHIRKFFEYLSSTDDEDAGLVETLQDAEEGWTVTRNLSPWCNWLTFDIMGDVIFGLQYNLLGDQANREIPEAIEESNVRVSVLLQSPFIRQIGRLDRWLFPQAIAARGIFLRFVNRLVEKCMNPENPPSARTVLSILRSSTDPDTGEKLNEKELLAESTTLVVAGADTTSTALAAVLFYLAHDSRAYEKAANEVRSTFTSSDEIRMGAKLGSLRYVRACIDEAMRMSPPVGSSLYRSVLPGGASVEGDFFPAGVQLGVPIYALHHNPNYFPEPFTFRPERWIVDGTGLSKASVELAQSALCPFSIGPRSCVGKGMALIELSLAVSFALFTLDFRLAEGPGSRNNNPRFITKDHITATKTGPFLQFRQRDTNRVANALSVLSDSRQRDKSAPPPLRRSLLDTEEDRAEAHTNGEIPPLKVLTRQPTLKQMAMEEIFSPRGRQSPMTPASPLRGIRRQDSFKPQSLRRQATVRDDAISPLRRQDSFKPQGLRRQGTMTPMSPMVNLKGNDIFISTAVSK